MQPIALRYLGVEAETIKNLKAKHRENIEAFIRDIIRQWMNRNVGINQVEVRKFTITQLYIISVSVSA